MMARHDDLHDLIAAYALDSLDDAEARQAEVALAADPALRRELDDHHAVLAALANAVDPHPSTPSPMVWQNIVAQIDGAGDVGPKLASVYELRTQRRFTRVTAALSVAAIALAALLGVSVVRLQQERTEPAVEAAIQQLLDDPAATVVTLAAAEGLAAEARIVVGADGVGYVYADNLPVLAEDRTYQLWAVVDDRVISAGVLGNDPDNSPFQVVGDIAGFAITEEVAGGVPVSEGATVAVWLRNA
jgi:anti-sigma-K factor RskA